MMKENRNELKLISQELNHPYKQLNLAFLLIGIIPILACIYLLCDRLFSNSRSLSQTAPILFFSNVIIILGYIVGYGVVKNILNKILAYATRAKRADELKSALAMALAHDLKNPLAVIKMNGSNFKLGLLGNLTPKQEDAADVSKNVINRMEFIIMNLIKAYTIEAGMTEPKLTRFDLRELVQEQTHEVVTIAHAKNMTLTTELSKKALPLLADRIMILRVINNLLSNAIKYTPQAGKIMIKVTSSDDFARLEVLNSGVPIPEDMLEKIFNKFEHLDKTIEGEGLGLAIAKDIVEIHKGKIWAVSAAGKPNCFTVLLPLAKA